MGHGKKVRLTMSQLYAEAERLGVTVRRGKGGEHRLLSDVLGAQCVFGIRRKKSEVAPYHAIQFLKKHERAMGA